MNLFVQQDIIDMSNDIKYLLKMVRNKRYHYDLQIACDIYNNIISIIDNIYNLIVRYSPENLYILHNELNDKDTALDLLELVIASPIENLYKYKQLGLLDPVYNILNYLLNTYDQEAISRLMNRYDFNYTSLGHNNINYKTLALYCISEIYNLKCDTLVKINTYNIQEAQHMIFNESINILKHLSNTYPIFTQRFHKGHMNYTDIINNIWNLIYTNKINKDSTNILYELTNSNDIDNDSAYSFYKQFENMSSKILEYILSLIGPIHANVIIVMAKLRYVNLNYHKISAFSKIHPVQDWSRLYC